MQARLRGKRGGLEDQGQESVRVIRAMLGGLLFAAPTVLYLLIHG